MNSIESFLKKYEIYIFVFSVLFAGFFLIYKIGEKPFVDYDEATYAGVIMDTMASGDLSILQRAGVLWFEKPPLYFWFGMLSVKIFGGNEFAMRLPSAVCSLIILLFTYFITKKVTGNISISILAVLILLFSPLFYYLSREVRVDSSVIMMILMALYSVIMGWGKRSYLLLTFPFIAIGFLFKSVIALFAIPIILLFCLVYKQWGWIQSRYLWWGLPAGMLIVLPWHINQSLKFGRSFWDQYLGYHVIARGFQGIGVGMEKASGTKLDYLLSLWNYSQPTIIIFLIVLVIYIFYLLRKHKRINEYNLATLVSAAFILIAFSFFKTHILTYLMPMFPFVAMSASGMLHDMFSSWKGSIILILYGLLILISAGGHNRFQQYVYFPYHVEQRDAVLAYSKQNDGSIPIYVLQWPIHETIRYYSKTKPVFVNFQSDKDIVVDKPFFLLLNKAYIAYFRGDDGEILPEYGDMVTYYNGKYLMLLYSDSPIKLYKREVSEDIYMVK